MRIQIESENYHKALPGATFNDFSKMHRVSQKTADPFIFKSTANLLLDINNPVSAYRVSPQKSSLY